MSLRLESDGAIGRILIDRPEKRNAFNQAMWEQFPVLLGAALIDRAIRVVVVQSTTQGMFCAGADITELMAHKDNAAWREANQAAIYRTQHELARFAKPTIALIDGDCVGGGCGIAIACDIRVATAGSRIGITPAKLGLVYPLHDTKLLVDLVGPGQAKKMLFTGELLSAEEALRIGLIEMIDANATTLAQQIAANSAHSTHEIKCLVRRILDGQADDDLETKRLFAEAFSKVDFAEGTNAFVEKRKPKFK
ncbi:enoyl-CoA hydratase/isomerase family protein [Sphingorhabdus sp.]|jgi:enoyl-CoA hydratase/carnithine racemase|uniref:enoyl-CoA hydratase/isomerase family protein n=1 Tax=Sphingorhabdus sp. TaxID=1902408 RepID=UPI0038FC88C6